MHWNAVPMLFGRNRVNPSKPPADAPTANCDRSSFATRARPALHDSNYLGIGVSGVSTSVFRTSGSDILVVQFFVVELDDFLDRPSTLTKFSANCHQLLQHDRGARDCLEYQ